MENIAWILFVLAAIAAVIGFIGQSEPKKRLADAEAKLNELEAALANAQKQPVAIATTGIVAPPVNPTALADAEKRLNSTVAEVKRLEATIAETEKRVQAEREKAETALAKAASAEAMVLQARSKAAEAGHSATQEAKKETEAVRAQLVETEKRLLAIADSEKRINELSSATLVAKNEAAVATTRVQALQTEAESLRTQLAKVEAFANKAKEALAVAQEETEQVRQETAQSTEKTLRESFEAQLLTAKATFEKDLQTRLQAERERFEGEQRRLSLELEKARLDAVQIEAVAAQTPPEPVEASLPARARTRPTATKAAEIGGEGDEKPLVILADSDANAVKTISQHLEAGGYAVRIAKTMAEAMDIAHATPPAALAIDGANLPDGDCWKVLTTIKEDADLREIPVLVFAPGKDKERALEMGAAGCFAKPVDKAVLVATIKAAMVKRKQRARLAAVSGGGGVRRSSLLTSPNP